jgi:hypothetical protein
MPEAPWNHPDDEALSLGQLAEARPSKSCWRPGPRGRGIERLRHVPVKAVGLAAALRAANAELSNRLARPNSAAAPGRTSRGRFAVASCSGPRLQALSPADRVTVACHRMPRFGMTAAGLGRGGAEAPPPRDHRSGSAAPRAA